jgi:hypothetical protein
MGRSVISGCLDMNICVSWNIGSPLQEISWNIWEKSFAQKKKGHLCSWRTFHRWIIAVILQCRNSILCQRKTPGSRLQQHFK